MHLSIYLLCTLALATTPVLSAWKTFVVPHSPGHDDTPGLVAALPRFSSNATILFSKGVIYNIFTPIRFPAMTNVEIRIEGNLSYPSNIAAIQSMFSSMTPRSG